MLSCIPLTAYLTQLQLGQIIHLCNYKETVHRIDSVNLFSLLKKKERIKLKNDNLSEAWKQ